MDLQKYILRNAQLSLQNQIEASCLVWNQDLTEKKIQYL
jgi:hypothetical protein